MFAVHASAFVLCAREGGARACKGRPFFVQEGEQHARRAVVFSEEKGAEVVKVFFDKGRRFSCRAAAGLCSFAAGRRTWTHVSVFFMGQQELFRHPREKTTVLFMR